MTVDRRFFLDVRRSATGISWEHRLNDRQEMAALAIAQGHGTGDLLARVLAGRGVTSETTERFLDPTIR
ncbi:single-stranded-DNA-specific exonuclease RecJ, partial [Rhizobiaceae sp. 2RAB30]